MKNNKYVLLKTDFKLFLGVKLYRIKAKKAFGFEPKITLENGIKDYYNWLKTFNN